MDTKKVFIYYDVNFRNNFGHYFTIYNNIAELSKKNGYDMIHIKDKYYCIESFLKKLIDYSHIIFYSYYFVDINTYVYLNNIAHKFPNINFYINYMPPLEKSVKNDISYLKTNLSFYPNFYLLVDTSTLYTFLSDYITINILHINCPIFPQVQYDESIKNTCIHIGYYLNKYPHIDSFNTMVSDILTNYPNTTIDIKSRSDIAINIQNIKSTFLNRINYITEFVSLDSYYNFIRANDIIVLNYEKDDYFYRSSGIFMECLYFKKIIVTIKGTWMETMLTKYGSGVCFVRGNIKSFACAIKSIIDNYNYYKKRTEYNYEKYINDNKFDNIFTGFKNIKVPMWQKNNNKLLLVYNFQSNQKYNPYEYDINVLNRNISNYNNILVDCKQHPVTYLTENMTTIKSTIDSITVFMTNGSLSALKMAKSINNLLIKHRIKYKIFVQLMDYNVCNLDDYIKDKVEDLVKFPNIKLCINYPNLDLLYSHRVHYVPFPLFNYNDININPIEPTTLNVMIILIKMASLDTAFEYMTFDTLNEMKSQTKSVNFYIWTPNKLTIKNKKLNYRFKFINGVDQFHGMINDMHILIVPYISSMYNEIIPEFIIHAIKNNCTMLVPQNSSVGNIVEKYGIGLTYEPRNNKSFINQYYSIVRNHKDIVMQFDKYKLQLVDYLGDWTIEKFFENISIH